MVLKMEKQSIIELDLDEMHISTENPRTKIVIDEIQAIYEIIFEHRRNCQYRIIQNYI